MGQEKVWKNKKISLFVKEMEVKFNNDMGQWPLLIFTEVHQYEMARGLAKQGIDRASMVTG